MFKNSSGFALLQAHPSSAEAQLHWLRATQQLDILHPHLTATARRLISACHNTYEQAQHLHDFVKCLPFQLGTEHEKAQASDILKQGSGDALGKGILLVALLRSIQIPARLRMISLPKQFMQGLMNEETSTVLHAMTEVCLEDHWWAIDTYVLDPKFEAAALALLNQKSMTSGFGKHRLGSSFWKATPPNTNTATESIQLHASAFCSVQDAKSLPVVDWGVADDYAHFLESHPRHIRPSNIFSRLRDLTSLAPVNRRIKLIREGKIS